MCKRYFPFFVFFLLVIYAFPLPAQGVDPTKFLLEKATPVSLRLLQQSESVAKDQAVVRLGLSFELQPGWHMYWRTSGDSGYPPQVEWKEAENLASSTLLWPAPTRFIFAGFTSFGYEKSVVLPIDVVLQRPGEKLKGQLSVEYLVCKDICLPLRQSFAVDIVDGLGIRTPDAAVLDRAAENLPTQVVWGEKQEEEGGGLRLVSLHADAKHLLLQVQAKKAFVKPDVFVEATTPSLTFASENKMEIADNMAKFAIPYQATAKIDLKVHPLFITLVDGDQAIEYRVSQDLNLTAEAQEGQKNQDGHSSQLLPLLSMLFIAFLGGMVLNLMPCVFPVLSLKILSFLKSKTLDRAGVRANFLASSLGILFSFLLFSLLAILLKSLGVYVGWGMQFQSPLFLLLMLLILVLFALNLWGIFSVQLPHTWAQKLQAWDRRFGREGTTPLENFFTGIFVTLLATPCSAPFLGTALGYSLSRGPQEIILIFFFIGLGLSFPYLLLALYPGLMSRLPKPGRWTKHIKTILGGFLCLTALWVAGLLWQNQYGHIQDAQEIQWQNFDLQRIDNMIAADQTVFIDVTAAWCLTCQVNKKFVLDTKEVQQAFRQHNVFLFRADITMPKPEINAYMAQYNRFGIPFNRVHGPADKMGIVLPELLNKFIVLEALKKAQNKNAQPVQP